MHVAIQPDAQAVVLRPEAGDRPEDLEDAIHDAVLATRREEALPTAKVVVLDFSGLDDDTFPQWMKAAGPEVPDANLRVLVSPKHLAVARALGLTAFYEWYDSLDAALRGGV